MIKFFKRFINWVLRRKPNIMLISVVVDPSNASEFENSWLDIRSFDKDGFTLEFIDTAK